MAYQVLARKWRPQNFAQMVGQEHVLRALINALDLKRLHHAYLFTGTRGVGKTTVARILAKCLNCEIGITSQPCNHCSTCQAINEGRFVDLIEVDAASRTKVEDTRELLDNVQYAPTQGRFKIYLIDEVHMLSGHSFNALLKTLEEPPEHVKFLLATTDPQKLPITILSRCLQFYLKNLNSVLIEKQLADILQKENFEFEQKALTQLAIAADGSMRDALSLTDQAIAFTNGKIHYADICEMLGTLEQSQLSQLLSGLVAKNPEACLKHIAHLAEKNTDFEQVLEDLLFCFQQIAVHQITPNLINDDLVKQFSPQLTREDIQLYYQIALIGKRDLPHAPNPKAGFEMIMLRMLVFTPSSYLDSDSPRNAKESASSLPIPSTSVLSKHSKDQNQGATDSPFHGNGEKKIENQHSTATRWLSLIHEMKLSGLAHALALNCALTTETHDRIELTLPPQHAALYNEKQKIKLTEALNQVLQRTIHLDVHIKASDVLTPAEQQKKFEKIRHDESKSSIENDQKVQTILKTFGGSIQQTRPREIKE